MAALTEEQARAYMHRLLATMSQQGGSDLFISHDFPPSMKAHGSMTPLAQQKLSGEVTKVLAYSLMNADQKAEFDKEMECNFAISIPGLSRFRVNIFRQQRHVGLVIRTIAAEIPNFEKLGLPPVLKEVIMNKRGLVLVVGGTVAAVGAKADRQAGDGSQVERIDATALSMRYESEDDLGSTIFAPVEFQVVDAETAQTNERGDNAHARYKKRQLRRVLSRLSRGLVVPKRRKPTQTDGS